MPELPEVETVRAGLQDTVTGAKVTRVEILDARSLVAVLIERYCFNVHSVGFKK